jgi:hypothetical protein
VPEAQGIIGPKTTFSSIAPAPDQERVTSLTDSLTRATSVPHMTHVLTTGCGTFAGTGPAMPGTLRVAILLPALVLRVPCSLHIASVVTAAFPNGAGWAAEHSFPCVVLTINFKSRASPHPPALKCPKYLIPVAYLQRPPSLF